MLLRILEANFFIEIAQFGPSLAKFKALEGWLGSAAVCAINQSLRTKFRRQKTPRIREGNAL